MLVTNLLKEIGFTKEQETQYFEFKGLIGNRLDNVAKGYMNSDISFADALKIIQGFENEKLHKYTLNLLFVLECSSYLLEKYQELGIDREIFVNSMKDLKYKLEECLGVEKVFGTNVVEWYERFLDLRRVALGRLQFNLAEFEQESTVIAGCQINKGDFAVACHIPSSGPLKPEMSINSFKMAYEFYKDRIKDGILVITCHSWLLYPPYRKAFGENSNTAEFAKNFKNVKLFKNEKFEEAWRVFGMNFDGDIEKLPTETRMQRAFIEYLKTENDFGNAYGVVLFDGKNILTRE